MVTIVVLAVLFTVAVLPAVLLRAFFYSAVAVTGLTVVVAFGAPWLPLQFVNIAGAVWLIAWRHSHGGYLSTI